MAANQRLPGVRMPMFRVPFPQMFRGGPMPVQVAPNPFFNPAFMSYSSALQGALGQMASLLGRNQQAMLAIRQMLLNSPVIQEWLRQRTQLRRLPIEKLWVKKFSPVERERVRVEGLTKALESMTPYVHDVYRS